MSSPEPRLCSNPACRDKLRLRQRRPLCDRCHSYWQRNGQMRPESRCHPPTICLNPNCDMPKGRKNRRCDACRLYLWRHGVERPEWMCKGFPQTCIADGCNRPTKAIGRCKPCRKRLQHIRQRERRQMEQSA